MTSKSRVCVSSIPFTVAALCGQLQLIRRGRKISLQESRALLRSRTSRDQELGCREMKDTPQRPSLRQHYISAANLDASQSSDSVATGWRRVSLSLGLT